MKPYRIETWDAEARRWLLLPGKEFATRSHANKHLEATGARGRVVRAK